MMKNKATKTDGTATSEWTEAHVPSPPLSGQDNEPAMFMSARALDSLGYSDHHPESGVGELLDNAQEAGASKIQVFTQTRDPEPGKRTRYVNEIAVIDNGSGMDYSTIKYCLVLGKSMRQRIDGKMGIGRFGVGLTTGALALAHRIEVYSRTTASADFLATYIDTEEMMQQEANLLPLPISVPATAPQIAEYARHISGQSGTIVVLKKIWVKYDAKNLDHFIGRTYRKFIELGTVFEHNDHHIYLHDPLYMAGPTKFDAEAEVCGKGPDKKATLYGTVVKLPCDIPDAPGQQADVELRFSLLPQEWWLEKNSGGKKFARERRIPENEGVSILRAGREVFYGRVPRLFGTSKEGRTDSDDIDRWWGCEISFPPELDYLFEVRFVKAGVVPKDELRDRIKDKVGRTVKNLQDKIRAERKAYQADKLIHLPETDPFVSPEKIMLDASKRMKRIQQGGDKSDQAQCKKKSEVLDHIVDKRLDAEKYADIEARAKKKNQLSSLPLVVSPRADFFSKALFYPEYLPGQIALHLNVRHPFYTKILEPLCGQLDTNISEDDLPAHAVEIRNDYLVNRSEVKNAIFLLLFSLAKGDEELLNEYEHQLEDDVLLEEVLQNYNDAWGAALATAVRTAERGLEK